ncbi:MAG: hypothetical protein DRI69_03665 [Bacteroidetes bacterium]|nr:MAG: hypothetical protein DRI69_03665 [Bacteroidota bacterium]
MKALLKYSLITAILIGFGIGVHAQTERTKDFNESWDGIHKVSVDHRHGTLEIIPYTGNKVKLEAHILVHAKEENDAQTLIDHFEIKVNTSDDKLEIETKFNTRSWVTTNNNTKIKFTDGSKVAGIKKIDIKYKLHVPALESLEISNKYNDIEITNDFDGDLIVRLYDATLKTRNISGKLDLNLKYGKAYIETIGDLELEIYDSKLELVAADNIRMKSKYSGAKLGQLHSARIDSYDGYCNIKSVTGELHIIDKYSNYEIGSVADADVTMYDGKMHLDKVTSYIGSSKYSAYDIDEAGSIALKATHDDRFNIQSLGSLACDDSKYTSYEIETLSKKAIIKASYDDEFVVSTVDASFKHFEIDCKYTSVRLPLSSLPGYEINAKMKYGKLSYAEPSDNIVHKEHNGELELRAKVGDANSDAKVIINGYDSYIRLK